MRYILTTKTSKNGYRDFLLKTDKKEIYTLIDIISYFANFYGWNADFGEGTVIEISKKDINKTYTIDYEKFNLNKNLESYEIYRKFYSLREKIKEIIEFFEENSKDSFIITLAGKRYKIEIMQMVDYDTYSMISFDDTADDNTAEEIIGLKNIINKIKEIYNVDNCDYKIDFDYFENYNTDIYDKIEKLKLEILQFIDYLYKKKQILIFDLPVIN